MTDTTPEAVERLIGPGAEAMPDGERLTALVQMCRALSAEVQRLTSHHYTGSRVEDAITAHWGSRCYDFAEGCSCCEAWAEYDRLTAAAQTPPEDVAALETEMEHIARDMREGRFPERSSRQRVDAGLPIVGVSRMFDNPKALLLMLTRVPTDDEIRAIHAALAKQGGA